METERIVPFLYHQTHYFFPHSGSRMTQERFFRIVDEPDLLRTITYEELKTLALAYPYAHNLRYLLAIKARQIEHQDVVKNVATAATYSLDRSRLFRLVAPQMIAPQEIWAEEAVLELKPIETLKRQLEEVLTGASRADKNGEPHQEAAQAPTPAPVPPADIQEINTPAFDFSETAEIAELPPIPYQTFALWIAQFQPPGLEQLEWQVGEPAPEKRTAAIETPETSVQQDDFEDVEPDNEEREESPASAKATGIAQALAEKSVAENKDVISETLAKLYAKQGYRDKAIAMYERLGLAFPEKSTYFAAEIDKLKK